MNSGFAAFYSLILILGIVCATTASISFVVNKQQKAIKNVVRSSQSYYSTEAGVEDALLRLVTGKKWSNPILLEVGTGLASTTISDDIGGQRNIISQGNVSDRIRKIEVISRISVEEENFYYAAQVGDNGIVMQNNSQIRGNVFSNGSILASGLASATGTVIVAKDENQISGLEVGKNAKVYTCQNSEIKSTLTCVINKGCTAQTIEALTEEISPLNPPISTLTIQGWKKEASDGGTIGYLHLSGSQTLSLGPKKIEGNLLLENQAKLTITGTIWVTGDIHLQNSAILELASDYGSNSGVIITDEEILLENNVITRGSSQKESYLMLLSTSPSLELGDPAIEMKNNAQSDILYTSRGAISLINSANLRSIYATKLFLQNNVVLSYEVGLESVEFFSGPSRGWKVISWKEIE
ncbi:MAG: hypothetical protein Q8O39_02445 [bacterium]|nr:hypothetical protein [bacterium]